MGSGIIRISSELYGKSLDGVIVALCRDYERRCEEIKQGRLSRRVLMEYRLLDSRIIDGASEVVGLDRAEDFISEIGLGVGYAKSSVITLSESCYKINKREVKINIAKKLRLL